MAFAWWNVASCRDLNTDLFFSEEPFSQQRAKAICSTCPCRNACLGSALDESRRLLDEGRPEDDLGIFAGTTGSERQEMICPGTVGQSEGDEGA